MALPGAAIFERAGLRAWPGIELEWDGAWLRRAAGGYTKRANSVQSLDPADDDDAEARLIASRTWFTARGLRPTFRITPLASPAIVALLDEQGWQTVDASHLFAMPLPAFEPESGVEIHDLLDPRFLAAQQHLHAYSDDMAARFRALLAVIDIPACGMVVYSPDGEPVASALMDIADGIVVAGNVVTGKAYRRQGHAANLMRTGLAWAAEAGATIAVLNVAADNTAGQALYTALGYRRQYDYTYRIPAAT